MLYVRGTIGIAALLLGSGLLTSCAPKQQETALKFEWNADEVLSARKKYGPMAATLPSNYCYMIHVQGDGIGLWAPPSTTSSCPVLQRPHGTGKMAGLFPKGVNAEISVLSGNNRVFHLLGFEKGSVSEDNPSVVIPNDCSGLMSDFQVPAGTTDLEDVEPTITYKNTAGAVGSMDNHELKVFGYASTNVEAGTTTTISLTPALDAQSGQLGTDYGCGNSNSIPDVGIYAANMGYTNTSSIYIYFKNPTGMDYANSAKYAFSEVSCAAASSFMNISSQNNHYYFIPGPLQNTTHNVYVKFSNAAGTVFSDCYQTSITHDNVAPSLTITSPSGISTTTTDFVTVTGTCSVPQGKIAVREGGQTLVEGSCSATNTFSVQADLAILSNGSYNPIVYHYDKALNYAQQALPNVTKAQTLASVGISVTDAYYPGVPTGKVSVEKTITINNSGPISASISSIVPILPFAFGGSGGTFPGTGVGTSPGFGGTCGATLNAGSSCTVKIRTKSAATGYFEKDFTVNYNDGATARQKKIKLSAEFVTPEVYSLYSKMPGQTFTEGVWPPVSGAFSVYEGLEIPVEIYAITQQGYVVNSFNSAVTVANTANEVMGTSTGWISGKKTYNIKFLGRNIFRNVQFSSPGVNPANVSTTPDFICNAPGNFSAPFKAGAGTVGDPYLICDYSNWVGIASTVTSGFYYNLAQDITYPAPASSIGGSPCTTNAFNGFLDGKGYRLLNVEIMENTKACSGIFASMNDGAIRNLVVEYVNPGSGNTNVITANSALMVGGLVGQMLDGNIENVQLLIPNNAIFDPSANGSSNILNSLGGLVGHMEGGTIADSQVTLFGSSNINGMEYTGGLVGYVDETNNTSVIFNTAVRGSGQLVGNSNSPGSALGGLVGYMDNGGIFESTTGDSSPLPNIQLRTDSAAGYAGGLVGRFRNSSVIEDSYSVANIIGTTGSDIVGGLVGKVESGSISRVFYTEGSISSTSGFAGTLFGQLLTPVCNIDGCATDVTTPGALIYSGTDSNAFLWGSMDADINFSSGWTRDPGDIWMLKDGVVRAQLQRRPYVKWNGTFQPAYGISGDGLNLWLSNTVANKNIVSTEAKSSGKWYWEIKVLSGEYDFGFGIVPSSFASPNNSLPIGGGANSYTLWSIAGTSGFYSPSYDWTADNGSDCRPGSGKTFGIALNLDSNTLRFFVNGVECLHTGGPAYNINPGTYKASFGDSSNASTPAYDTSIETNFGHKPFQYTPPTGYKPFNYIGPN